MLDIVSLATIDVTLHALSAGAHIVNASRISKIEKIIKQYRYELMGCEVGVALTGIIQVCDHFVWKREVKKFREEINCIDSELRTRMDNLSMRIDNLSSTIADRAPVVTIVPTPVEKEPEVVDVEESK